jgi:hypothetical protein
MAKIPARILASLERAARAHNRLKTTNPEAASKLKRIIAGVVMAYHSAKERARIACYISASVRFKGIWRDWRRAGLEHLDDRAMVRWCGFPKRILFMMAENMRKDPDLAALDPSSKYFKRLDPRDRPICDVLDILVLSLREIATVGYQHQLCSDMGIPMGSITKYLVRGKKALMKMLKAHPASRVGFFEHMAMGLAAMRALEMQHGECPQRGVIYAFALDGTITPVFTPEDEELKVLYYSLSKKISAVNSVFLVSPLGTIHAFRVAATGNTPDQRLAQPIFEWLFDPDVNPFKYGVITDYGMASQCSSDPRYPPVSRPFAPTKDTPIADPALALQVAAFSRWLCTCRQFNEWVNGSAKRGFPRMLCKTYVHHVEQLRLDMELYLLLYNVRNVRAHTRTPPRPAPSTHFPFFVPPICVQFRVRTCEWSQTRTVYLEHAQAVFDEQGLLWNEAEGVFLAKDRGDPPMEE